MDENPPVTAFSGVLGLPSSTHLLAILASQLDAVYDQLSHEKISLTESDLHSPSEFQSLILQLLCLAVLSMHGGVFVPNLRRVEFKAPVVTLTWDSGAKDRFSLGKLDDGFKRFVSYFYKLTFRKSIRGNLDLFVVNQWVNLLVGNTQILGVCNDRIEQLITSDFNLLESLAEGIPPDVIFILISALPIDQLNQLFLFLYPFFPSDLVVKMPEGNKVNVCSLFQSPSQDIRFLMEKIRVYLRLYTSPDFPVIRIITQTKTTLFLSGQLQQPSVSNSVKQGLLSIREHQILSRMKLYYLITDVLTRLLK